MPFLLLFVVYPLLELALMIKVGAQIGALATIGWILFTAVLGIMVMRGNGFLTMFKIRSRLAQGELPAREIANGFLLTLAGVLIFLPGFIGDALGFLLLLGPVRKSMLGVAVNAFKKRQGARFAIFTQGRPQADSNGGERPVYDAQDNRLRQDKPSSTIIDAEFRRED